jgi:hypothetical protein
MRFFLLAALLSVSACASGTDNFSTTSRSA